MSRKEPWFKFYPADWRADPRLRMCSIGARGLWAEMLCVMHEAEPYGYLLSNGNMVNSRQMAGLAGIPVAECMRYTLELASAGVYSIDENKRIFSRRMVRDKAKAEKDRANGKGGGNPKLRGAVKEGVNPPDKAQIPEARFDVADDARKPLVGVEAMDLAEQLMVIAGHDPGFWPPGWCGAPMRVQTWLNQSWPAEIIVAATKSAAARKHGAPAASVQFFEKAIAEEIARQAAPVPQVEVRKPDKITVSAHGKPQAGNIIQAANRLVDTIRSFDAGPGEADGLRGGTGAADVRLLSQG